MKYPIKTAMILITTAGEVVRFTYFYISMHLVHDAAHHLIQSYNHHRIHGPGGGVPIGKMEATKKTAMLPVFVLPTTQEAVMMYEAGGGLLTRSSELGHDPLLVAKYHKNQ